MRRVVTREIEQRGSGKGTKQEGYLIDNIKGMIQLPTETQLYEIAIVCIQEIANQGRIDTFVSSEVSYSSSAFQDSSDGQDNAIFAKASVTMLDIADPTGFQHPVQAAYVARNGFDAVIVTVPLVLI
jgi:hypothetical protein